MWLQARKGGESMSELNDSKTLKTSSRTYFFDLKQTGEGKNFLVITESRKTEGDQFDRRSIAVFPEDAAEFLQATQEMAGQLT